MVSTDAWVLDQGPPALAEPGELENRAFEFDELRPHEVLLEPLVGSWEANLTHAIQRDPIDVALQRGDKSIVLGNSGMCRVADVGAEVDTHEKGELVFYGCAGVTDHFGYVELVSSYDAPGSVGTLAKQTKVVADMALKMPANSKYSLEQWAPYPRYWTAWSNQKVAMACLRSQLTKEDVPKPHVLSWGGGVGFAQLELANAMGCHTSMIASSDARLADIEKAGIRAIDRREFPDLNFDPWGAGGDEYKKKYRASEQAFLKIVNQVTNGQGVHILIENIGTPVYRASLRALARQGVITTCGWKKGMLTSNVRAAECIARHIHVHTHAISTRDTTEVIQYQEETGWVGPQPERIWQWDEIPDLANQYSEGTIDSYFPIFKVQD